MIARLDHLRKHPAVFRALTGLTPAVFDALLADVLPALADADFARRDRPDRDRAVGAGHPPGLTAPDRLLLAVVWLRVYPTHAVLGYLFGVSESAARRLLGWSVPVLAAAGRDTMRMPDPGKYQRKTLPALLRDTPGRAVLVDTFEQPTHRPKRRQRAWYSGKKKRHTIKTQVGVDEESGRVVHVPPSAPGPRSDLTLLKGSGLLGRLPRGVGVIGDTAYLGIGAARPDVPSATPPAEAEGEAPAGGRPAVQPGGRPPAGGGRAHHPAVAGVPGAGPGEPARAEEARGAGAGGSRVGQPDDRRPHGCRLIRPPGGSRTPPPLLRRNSTELDWCRF